MSVLPTLIILTDTVVILHFLKMVDIPQIIRKLHVPTLAISRLYATTDDETAVMLVSQTNHVKGRLFFLFLITLPGCWLRGCKRGAFFK